MLENYEFKYGDQKVLIPINTDNILGVLESKEKETIKDIKAALYQSLDNPIDSEPLSSVASRVKSIALVVSDATRAWMHQELIVPHLVDYLISKCGKSYCDIKIIIANGTHVGGSEETLKSLVTEDVYNKIEVINHDAFKGDLTYMGKTSYGTKLYVNKAAADADLVICLGAATYHVMAGFGGGRKSILPGIAGIESIKHNHAYSLHETEFITNPEIGNGVLDKNPLNEDMLEAASMMKNLFMISLVTDADFHLANIFSGHYKTSWLEACKCVKEMYRVPIKEKADCVITSCGGYPKDESLYQGTKTVDNTISALKDGGTLILLLEGRNGGGSPDYFDWIKPLVNGTFEKELRENFTVGGYIFFLNCEQARRFKILMYSKIDKETVEPMGINAYDNLEKLIEDADLENKSIYVIPNGSTVFPEVEE